jgi:DNA polymerase III epsilon subunit-like protein
MSEYVNSVNNNYYLSIHVETTGINNVIDEPVYKNNEIVCLSAVVCEKRTFKTIDEIIIFIDHGLRDIGTRWHGITPEFLEENGLDEESAVVEFSNFILQYFDPDGSIITLGQNVHSFVLPFVKNLLYRNEVYIYFSSNSLDVFSITVPTIGETTIKELIELFGDVDKLEPSYQQEEYACLLKAKTFVEVFRKIDKTWTKLTK